jgi:hypothetical protein
VVNLTLDLDALGLEQPLRAWAPAVEGLQDAAEIELGAVPVPAGQGLFVRVEGTGTGSIPPGDG